MQIKFAFRKNYVNVTHMHRRKLIANPRRVTVNLPDMEWRVASRKANKRGISLSRYLTLLMRRDCSHELTDFRRTTNGRNGHAVPPNGARA